MCQFYIAQWLDGTISFFAASSEDEIFFILDRESVPDDRVKLYRVDCRDIKNLHIGTTIFNKDNQPTINTYSVGEKTKITQINLPF